MSVAGSWDPPAGGQNAGDDPDVLQPGAPWGGPLAPRELVVLALLSTGYTPDELPRILRASPERVRALLHSAVARLGVGDWRAAVGEARNRGLID